MVMPVTLGHGLVWERKGKSAQYMREEINAIEYLSHAPNIKKIKK